MNFIFLRNINNIGSNEYLNKLKINLNRNKKHKMLIFNIYMRVISNIIKTDFYVPMQIVDKV